MQEFAPNPYDAICVQCGDRLPTVNGGGCLCAQPDIRYLDQNQQEALREFLVRSLTEHIVGRTTPNVTL